MRGGMGKCGERWGKVCWGVRGGGKRCGERCGNRYGGVRRDMRN